MIASLFHRSKQQQKQPQPQPQPPPQQQQEQPPPRPSTTTMAETTVHQGPYQTIPADATPGLLFIKEFLPVLDSLSPDPSPLLNFFTPDALVTINANPSNTLDTVLPNLAKRADRVARFRRETRFAWDVARPDGGRTVLYESSSATVFKGDPQGREAAIKEFNVLELRSQGGGWVASELRSFLDMTPITTLAREIIAQAQKA